MQMTSFTQCCVGRIISGFGGGHADQVERDCSSRLTILEYVIAKIKECKTSGIAVIFAAPTSSQRKAVDALIELGFYHNDNGAHTNFNNKHKIYPMYYCVNEYEDGMYDHLLEEIKPAKAASKKANPFK